MSARIAVLSVLDGIIQMGHAPGESAQNDRDLAAAHAAVVELIGKAAVAARTLEESSNATDRFKGRMLTAALATAGGAA